MKPFLPTIATMVPAVLYALRRRQDGSFCIPYASVALQQLCGIAPAAVLDDASAFFACIHDDDLASVLQQFAQSAQQLTTLQLQCRIAQLGREQHWAEIQATPEPTGDGSITWYGMMLDITPHMQTQEQLLQAQKREQVGRLVSSAAHTLNNLLTVIQGYCDLINSQLPTDEMIHDDLEQIHRASLRATTITRQLLAFNRRQSIAPAILNLNEQVSGLVGMLDQLIGDHITLATALQPDLWPIDASPGQLDQILMNLILNTRDSMPKGGTISIATRNEQDPRPSVVVRVADMLNDTPAQAQTIRFDPVLREGTLELESWAARSDTPSIAAGQLAVATLSEPPAPPQPAPGTKTILLVEDEEHVRYVAQVVLQEQGYHVLEASDGQAALTLFEQHREEIDLVLTDVVMPKLGGYELAEQLKRLQPNIRVMFMSGYTAENVLRPGSLAHESAFLPKPFSTQMLTTKVHEMLYRA